MIERVENAHTVCCFPTLNYEASPYRRLELQYAKKLNKPIVTFMAIDEHQWKPTKGKWLDVIVNSKFLFGFSNSSKETLIQRCYELIFKLNYYPFPSEDTLPEPKDKLIISIKHKYLRNHQTKSISNEIKRFAEDIFEQSKRKEKRVVLFGDIGIGKSMFCEHATYLWATGDLWSEFDLVVLIHLRKLTKERYSEPTRKYEPMNLIEKEHFHDERMHYKERGALREMCDNRRILWILDGYDQFIHHIPEQVKHAFNKIIDEEHYILTSRPCTINVPHENKLEIIGFSDDDIENYVETYFHKQNQNNEIPKILNFIKSNPSVWTLSHTPINLELFCTTWTDINWSNTTQVTITTLYEHFVNFIFKHDSNNTHLRFLENVAFSAMTSSSRLIPFEFITKIAENCQYDLQVNSQWLNLKILKTHHNYNYVADVEQNPTKSYSFIQSGLQEYFAARYLVRQLSIDKQSAVKFINSYKYDQHFAIVIVFTVGILASQPNPQLLHLLMNIIESEPKDLIGMCHIQLIIQLFDELHCCKNYQNLDKHLNDIRSWFQFVMKQTNKTAQSNIMNMISKSNVLSKSTFFQEARVPMQTDTINTQTHSVDEEYTLIRTLQNSEWYQKLSASETLIRIGKKAATKDTLRELINLFRNPDMYTRDVARYTFIKISQNATSKDLNSVLIDGLQDPEWLVRKNACSTIRKIDDTLIITNDMIDTLIKTLSDPDERVQEIACEALVKIGEKAANNDTISTLTQLLQDSQYNVRKSACIVLKAMSDQVNTTETIDVLIRILQDDKGILRAAARETLGKIGQNAMNSYIIGKLIEIMDLENSEDDAREAVCQVFTKMGQKTVTIYVIEALTKMLGDKNWYIRKAACESLKVMGSKAAYQQTVQALIERLIDEVEEIRCIASDTVIGMSHKIATKCTINSIIRILDNRERDIAQNVYRTLIGVFVQVIEKNNLDIIIDALKSTNNTVRDAACEALIQADCNAATRDIISALIEILENSKSRYEIYAWKALKRMCFVARPIHRRPTYYVARREPEYSLIIRGLKALLKHDYSGHPYDNFYLINQALQYNDDELNYAAIEFIQRTCHGETDSRIVVLLFKILRNSDDRLKTIVYYTFQRMQNISIYDKVTEMVKVVVEALQDPDSDVKICACGAIKAMGKHAATKDIIDELNRTLTNSDGNVKRYACEALAAIVHKDIMEDCIDILLGVPKDSDINVQVTICKIFKQMGNEAASENFIEVLLGILRDGSEHAKKEACEALTAMGTSTITQKVLNTLGSLLMDPESRIEYIGIKTLTIMAEKGVTDEPIDILIRLLQKSKNEIKLRVCEAFAKLGQNRAKNDIINALTNAVRDPDSKVSKEACKALAAIGKKEVTQDTVDALKYVIHHSTPDLKKIGLRALISMDQIEVYNEIIDVLIEAMQDTDCDFMEEICELLTPLSKTTTTKSVIDMLIQKLRIDTRNYYTQNSADELLVKLADKKVLNQFADVFIQLLQDSKKSVKVTAYRVLTKIDPKVVPMGHINVVIKALNDPERDVKSSAWKLLVVMMETEPTIEGINKLLEAMRDSDWTVQSDASEAFTKLGKSEAKNTTINIIIQVLKNSEENTKRAACKALANMEMSTATKEVVDTLVKTLQDPEKSVRQAACQAFAKIGTNEAVDALVRALQDPETSVRQAACEAFAEMKMNAPTKKVINALIKALRDPERSVGRAACEVFYNINDQWLQDGAIEVDTQALGDSNTDAKGLKCETLLTKGKITVNNDTIDAVIDVIRTSFYEYKAENTFKKLWKYMDAEDSMVVLMNLLQDPYYKLKHMACETLQIAGDRPVKKEIVDLLIKLLYSYSPKLDSNKSDDLRKAAYTAFSSLNEKIITKDVINTLINTLHDPSNKFKHTIRNALNRVYEKTTNPDVINAIIQTLRHPDEEVRNLICEIFLWSSNVTASNDTINLIIDMFRDSNESQIRTIMCNVFSRININMTNKDTMHVLIQTFRDPDEDVRDLAYQRLLKMDEKTVTTDVVDMLIETMQYTTSPLVRSSIAELFGRWKFVNFNSNQINQILTLSGQINDAILKFMLNSESILSNISQEQIIELTKVVLSQSFFRYENISSSRLFQIWLAGSRSEWIPLLVHVALVNKTAIVRTEKDLVLHNLETEPISQPVNEEQFSCLLKIARVDT